MNNKEKQFSKSMGKGDNTQLLRVSVIFLSIVSFFTTANGMKKYIFVDNDVIAYAASAAIQGILLALSMNLPGYLINMYRKKEQTKQAEQIVAGGKLITEKEVDISFLRIISHLLRSTILSVFAILLTLVTIFCSTWFSYIYIADILHQDSWGADSELLIQQTYRMELQNARDYAHIYRIYLEDRIGEKLLLLEEQTKYISNSDENLTINWEDERQNYVEDAGTTVAGYMSAVINAMDNALVKDRSQTSRDIAATVITDTKANIADRMESIQENLDTINANITNYNTQITNLRNQINRAEEGTDIAALSNTINIFVRLLENLSQQQADLQIEYLQLSNALLRLSNYETELGLSTSTSAISIRANLVQLQTEFFKLDVNEGELINIATDIFQDFQRAARTAANDEGLQENFSYTNLLLQMNQLIQNLKDYSVIKGTESQLDIWINELGSSIAADNPDSLSESAEDRNSNEAVPPTETNNQDEATDPSEPDASAAPEDSNTSVDSAESTETQADTSEESNESEDISAGSTASGNSSDLIESGASNSDSKTALEEAKGEEGWKEKVKNLRALISAMPVYSEAEGTANGADSVLSESQINILTNYDRERSGKNLDDITRRYISIHNAVYQGIIYLQSPYRSLAVFALILALSFDLSGFIFGFVAQGQSEKKDDSNTDSDNITVSNHAPTKQKVMSKSKNKHTEWSVIKTLTSYIVLTGDYENRDGIYYYKAFKDGELYYWNVKDASPYSQGIYIEEAIDEEWSKGKMLPEDGQDLLFTRQIGGPKDGIYINCQLIFDEGSLILVQEGQHYFLAGIDEYVPVHSYNPNRGENRTIPSKQLAPKTLNDQMIVVALNTKGTRVAAIYIIEHL